MFLPLWQQQLPMLVLGGGSNLVFTEDFNGTVVGFYRRG